MRSRSTAICSAILAGLLFWTLQGCIFEPRDAQPPGNEETSWVVPDFPERVFQNMKTGLESLTGTNYEKSLGEGFVFVPLPGDRNNFPGTFDNWDRAAELEVLNKMVGDAESIKVDFTGLTPIVTETSYAQYESWYTLEIVSKTAPDTSTYAAKARFDLRERSKGWELDKWEEIEPDPSHPSWGFLRGVLAGS